MMPGEIRPAPADPDLDACIAEHRRRAKREAIDKVWKGFRASKCGGRWFVALERAYGHRCLYCDHAPGRCIDHAHAKAGDAAGAFTWDNFRLSCGDCNRLKGTRRVVDPLREDPRSFVVYDVTTGKPVTSPASKSRQKTKVRDTLRLLDHQILNDARRERRQRILDTMSRFLAGERGYDDARVLAELVEDVPNRAIARDLILGAKDDLHAWSALVRAVMRRLPALEAWALAPLGSGKKARPRRRA